jgi:hypothetical protein
VRSITVELNQLNLSSVTASSSTPINTSRNNGNEEEERESLAESGYSGDEAEEEEEKGTTMEQRNRIIGRSLSTVPVQCKHGSNMNSVGLLTVFDVSPSPPLPATLGEGELMRS